jgi:RiboL-PSP-HEPN
MICKSRLLKTLRELDRLYNSDQTESHLQFYSKLALIELCGWIEETMDDMVERCYKRCLKEEKNQKFIRGKIKRNSGFRYEENFREMLIPVIGLLKLERIERKLERTGIISRLIANLKALAERRNDAAHTQLNKKGVTITYNAPSQVIRDFEDIYAIFREFDGELRRNGC